MRHSLNAYIVGKEEKNKNSGICDDLCDLREQKENFYCYKEVESDTERGFLGNQAVKSGKVLISNESTVKWKTLCVL